MSDSLLFRSPAGQRGNNLMRRKIKPSSELPHEPSCDEVQQLLDRIVVDDPTITRAESDAFAIHMATCPICEKAFYLAEGMNEDGSYKPEDEVLIEQRLAEAEPYLMTIEESWQDLLLRCPELAEACERDERRQHVWQLFRRISQVAALAACLGVLVTLSWLLACQFKTGNEGKQTTDTVSGERFFAELVAASDRQPLALGQPVGTNGQRQEILLGGMHRVVMNQNTSATFDIDSQGTYQIQLACGEMYVEVVPGHPFTITTANARLDITGTKFDVKVQPQKTELTLLKGSVRFASFSQEQAVDVKAGYASEVVGQSAPTAPAAVDALAATVWAKEPILRNAVARAVTQADAELQECIRIWWRQPVPADPVTLDYAVWRDQPGQRIAVVPARAVAQISQAGQVDWIELLVASGDVWQFHYDSKLPASQPLTKVEPIAIARLARHYGVDEREMFRAVGFPDSTPIPMLPVRNPTPGEQYAVALRRWHDALLAATQDKPRDHGDLILFSLSASRYLATTRTAVYLWAKTHPCGAKQLLADAAYRAMLPVSLPTDSGGAWLKQLREQAMAATSSSQVAMEWFLVPAGDGCVSQANEHRRRLAALVAELLPAWQGDVLLRL